MNTEADGLFSDILPEDLERMRTCFDMNIRTYRPGQTICTYGKDTSVIGILLSGEASLLRVQDNGVQTLMEHLVAGDVFGEVFFMYAASLGSYRVACTRDARIQFFDFRHIFSPCSNACSCHSHLIENVLQLVSQKAIRLGERVEILSQRSIRQKLASCFCIMAAKSGSDRFELPFSLTALAEYLSVDRSAMMRELRKMREEGLLDIQRHSIHLLKELL